MAIDNFDRRKYKRLAKITNVRVELDDNSDLNISDNDSINVSAGGILIKINRKIDVGKIVKIRFLKPNSFDYFEDNAKVSRCEAGKSVETYYIGVEFYNLTEEKEKQLDSFVSEAENNNDKVIRISIEPTWNIVLNINDRIDDLFPDISKDVSESIRMISTELVENAVKYGEKVDALTGIDFALVRSSNEIIVKVANGVLIEDNVNRVIKNIDKIRNCADPSVLYIERLMELLESKNTEVSELGLYRIAYEGDCAVDYEYASNVLTITAIREYS